MNKQFTAHSSGLWVANDGEVFVPKCKGHAEHYTYGTKTSNGHLRVVYRGGKYPVHVLVAEVFLNDGKPIDRKRYAVHHIDVNPTNNIPENLVILTHGEHNRLHHINKVLNKEHRQKLSNAKKDNTNKPKKPVIGVNKKTGETITFESATDAWITLNINKGDICSCCNGRKKTAGGYYWQYA